MTNTLMSRRLHAAFVCAALVFVAYLTLGAMSAAASTRGPWTVDGVDLVGSESIGCSGGPFAMKAEMFGLAIEISATSVECLGGSSIFNEGEAGRGTKKLKFTGVTVTAPKAGSCEVGGGSFTTNSLSEELFEVPGDHHAFAKLTPATGSEIVTVPIENCLIAGEYPIEGSIAARGSLWGTESIERSQLFGPTVEAATGISPTLGGEPATLEGALHRELSGPNAGAEFGTRP